MTFSNSNSIITAKVGKEAHDRFTAFLKELFPAELQPKIFLVGGMVRDILTGRDCKDIDLVAALPEEKLRTLGFRPVAGKTTAPIMFRHDPGYGKIEVTLIEGIEALADDLASRDFTCNSMAMDFEGEVIDPLGGTQDVHSRKLKACSTQSFICDPLRIFRAFRFEVDGWRMTPGTEKLIRSKRWNERLEVIPTERFTREMQKALRGAEPARFFRQMLNLNVGKCYLPELFRMPQIPAGPVEHHPEGDLFTHSCQVLERVAAITAEPLARFCAFFHDLGKLSTDPALYPKHHGHDDAGFDTAPGFCDRLKLPTEWKRALAWVNRLHGNVNKWEQLRDSTKIRMAEQAIKAGIAEILPLVAVADKPGNQMSDGWNRALQIAAMTTGELGIDPLQLEMMKPETRGEFILQKRIEAFRMDVSLRHPSCVSSGGIA